MQLTGQRLGDQSGGNVLISGSLVAMDDHVYAGRALQNGYALIETQGTAGVGVTVENQYVGQTDAAGRLLVTHLLPYQANNVGIDQSSVPLQDQIDHTDQLVSVPRLGGAIVRFGVHALHAARGVLMLENEPVRYGTGTLLMTDAPVRTLIGLDGSFYFSDLPAGRYTLLAATASGEVSCAFTMPAGARPMSDLGKIACERHAGAAP
jgi:outer membrane usher protein